MSLEIERKFSVADRLGLLQALESKAAFLSEVFQEDTVFRGGMCDAHTILRLRREEGRSFLTYKRLVFVGPVFDFCEEVETEILPEKQSALLKILARVTSVSFEDAVETIFKDPIACLGQLGLVPDLVIRKKRVTYKEDDVLICVDSVDGLGEFVELEYCGDGPKERAFSALSKAKTLVSAFMGPAQAKGYADMLR